MKIEIFKPFVALFAVILTLVGCSSGDEPTPNENIQLGNGQVFNMENFIISYEQISKSDKRVMWDIRHEYEGNKLVKTHFDMNVHGIFRREQETDTHNYDTNGAIISSSLGSGDNQPTITYTYNSIGLISSYLLQDGVTMTNVKYNSDYQIIEKSNTNPASYLVTQYYYNPDGTIAMLLAAETGHSVIYKYSEGKLVERREVAASVSTIYEYDSVGRLAVESYKTLGDDAPYPTRTEYEYSSTEMTEKFYSEGLLWGSRLFNVDDEEIYRTTYYYDESDKFIYAIKDASDEEELVFNYTYYEGSITDLVLKGSSKSTMVVQTEEISAITMEYYDDDETKIYTMKLSAIKGTLSVEWFDADDSPIDEADVPEWVVIFFNKSFFRIA